MAEELANERTRSVIEKALREGWGFRRIQEQVEALVNGKAAVEPQMAGTGKATVPPFRANGSELVIRRTRLGSATAAELAALEQHLREVLTEVERARATLPALPVAIPESPPVATPEP